MDWWDAIGPRGHGAARVAAGNLRGVVSSGPEMLPPLMDEECSIGPGVRLDWN